MEDKSASSARSQRCPGVPPTRAYVGCVQHSDPHEVTTAAPKACVSMPPLEQGRASVGKQSYALNNASLGALALR